MPTIPAFRTALPKDSDFARGLEGLATSRVPVVLQPSGMAELDAVLGGGFPRGSLVELCGPASSGRTSLSLALLAAATQRQEACAFVDVSDSLDPASLAAAGVDISRLLWIRCGSDEGSDPSNQARPTPAISLQKDDVDAGVFRPSEQNREKPTTGFLWQHPRNQMRGIETSIPSLVKQATEQVLVAQALLPVRGLQSSLRTQSHQWPTKPHSQEWLCYSGSETGKNGNGTQQQHPIPVPSPEIHIVATCAGEQAEPDRQRPRRGENILRRRFAQRQTENTARQSRNQKNLQRLKPDFTRSLTAGLKPGPTNRQPTAAGGIAPRTKPWKRLEQALKTTDLLLHSGGWGVVVFDLGNISWVDARRIPLSTWFRFQRIVENTPTILLLLGEEPCAKSCASLVLRCQRGQEKWSSVAPANGMPGVGSAGSGLYWQPGQSWSPPKLSIATFQGFEIRGKVMRSRRQLQPANAARWQARTLCSGSF